ncbi:WecB/TagA/CpsF family glycosyltransferase [Neobacillus sp. Marseille-QA0830]
MKKKGNTNGTGYTNSIFKSQVNKSLIPTCNILGVEVAAVNMEWLLDFIKKNVKNNSGNLLAGNYICVSNVHTTVTSYEDKEYCEIQNGGIMAIPDGGPLSSVGRKRGYKNMSRTAGPNLMEELFKISVKEGYRHYFYGSTEDTLKKLFNELTSSFPGIDIVGLYSPPFRPMNDSEDEEIVNLINEAQPDFVWIGLGAPKQERWMKEHQGRIAGLMIGVGAGFDYFAGNIDRAPLWMQKYNLEWLFRLIQEPRRLFERYLYTNTKFIWLAMIRGK